MNEPLAFGAIERPQKVSDITIGSATAPIPIPDTYMPEYVKYTDMQSQVPCCGAGAGKSLKEVFKNIEGNPEHLSMKCLWDEIKSFDNVPYDSGTTLIAIMQALQKFGVSSEVLCPTNCVGADPTAFTASSNLTPEIVSDAATNKIDLGYAFEWSPTLADIKSAIFNHKAVIMLMRVGAEFWTGKDGVSSWQEKDILPLQTTFPVQSGHFVTAYGYDTEYIYFYNQWSDTWGREGIGYFGSDYISRVAEIGTAIDLAKVQLIAVLQIGSRGSAVSLLQKRLNIAIDGIFGPKTKMAVEAFQHANRLVPDGVVGLLTNEELNK